MDLLRRLRARVDGMIGRAVIARVNEAMKVQRLQITIRDDPDTHDDVEHFQPYGFSAVPPEGSEVLVCSLGGDRSHLVGVCAQHPEKRPKDGAPGSVGLYTELEWRVYIDPATGIVHLGAKAGAEFVALAAKTDARISALQAKVDAHITKYNAHVHPGVTAGGASTGTTPTVETVLGAQASVAATKVKAT